MSGLPLSTPIPVEFAMGELGQNTPTGACHSDGSVPAAAVM